MALLLGLLTLLSGGQRLRAAEVYPIWVSGIQVTAENQRDVLGDGTVSYADGRLLLRDASLTGYSLHTLGNEDQEALCGIYTGQSLEIVTEGSCAVNVSGHREQVARSYGIYAAHYCELTLSGSGSLTVAGGPAWERSFGVRGYDPLRVKGQVMLRVLGGTATNSRAEGVSNSYGIYARSLVIEDHADVVAMGGTAVKGFGIYCEGGELTVAGDSVVEATGKNRAMTAAELVTDERNRVTAWVNGAPWAEGAVRGMYNDFDTYHYVRLGDAGNPFGDVRTTDDYHDPVLWAVEAGVASGLSDTVFGPHVVCTRGQVLTFLWRAMGSPQPMQDTSLFQDVQPDSYCNQAVLWAVEQGITTGSGPDTFSPDIPCTRAQVLLFLWRAMGRPGGSEQQTEQDARFWAEQSGLLEGGLPLPDQPAHRAETITWIYRLFGEQPPEPEKEIPQWEDVTFSSDMI